MSTKKWHLTKKGEAKPCFASQKCPFGDMISDHFGSVEAARKAFEKREKDKTLPKKFEKMVGGHYDGERAIVDGRLGSWNTHVLTGFSPTFFPDDIGIQDDPESLPNSFSKDSDWRNVSRPALDSGTLWGVKDSQLQFVKDYNGENPGDYSLIYDEPVSDFTEEIIGRYLLGEKTQYDEELYQRNFKQMSGKEKFFRALSDRETGESNNLYYALVFPDKDLQPVLDRLGVVNVSVSNMNNGREKGLVYTVISPNGDSRSFSVYEHRNRDSIIIGGTTNWDRQSKPYGPFSDDKNGNDSKENFFSEFSYDTSSRQIAETLGYFLKSAQDGTLEDDQYLIENASRLDWNAILEDKIPGFGDWRRSREMDEGLRNILDED